MRCGASVKVWRSTARWILVGYLAIGLAISLAQNLWGALTDGLTAFSWTGSLAGNVVLVIWWFLWPALTWPVDVYWSLYHGVGTTGVW